MIYILFLYFAAILNCFYRSCQTFKSKEKNLAVFNLSKVFITKNTKCITSLFFGFLCANVFFSIFRSGNPGFVRVYARFLDFQVTRILLDPWIDYNSFVKRRPQFVCKGLSCFYVGTQKGNELGSGLYLIEMKSQRD